MEEITDKTILVTLVGIKNIKSTHNFRIEFDVFETDSPKIKNLIDQMDKNFYLLLVPYDED
jgi:hypothetical protein